MQPTQKQSKNEVSVLLNEVTKSTFYNLMKSILKASVLYFLWNTFIAVDLHLGLLSFVTCFSIIIIVNFLFVRTTETSINLYLKLAEYLRMSVVSTETITFYVEEKFFNDKEEQELKKKKSSRKTKTSVESIDKTSTNV